LVAVAIWIIEIPGATMNTPKRSPFTTERAALEAVPPGK
jgi:hypothetical protein